ncbi:SIR2 family protein [Lichenicola cladoniae]|uniref:SIR2 family protein n=1 Tax=Lichenicola cladoniae TaxID=1484109 RepID=A0A6M8HT98_9PROT|nr:SIR2 family protein [Lichenicola cladoniae]NPD65525.1 SIR2 family protein [Acetobacteraceae bacterium]QKE91421.1 SIR2 family protein [Lichenicola cladoniae]
MDFDAAVEDVTAHLTSERQAWLFGAGISCRSGLPLMYPLTELVAANYADAATSHHALFIALRSSLPANAHIEHVLSQLGDFITLAERSKNQTAAIAGVDQDLRTLRALHGNIRDAIRDVIRHGYHPAAGEDAPKVAADGEHVVTVDHHRSFMRTLFAARDKAGRPMRPLHFFTLNYDTLIEDALALERISFADGFSGGAMAYWSPETAYAETSAGGRVTAHLVKLHGSIDWHAEPNGSVIRCREGCGYPDRAGNVLIYPQATKYVATQRDPFASLFERLRSVLRSSGPMVFAICGYSFGDEHVDLQIEEAMVRSDCKTVLIAFVQEVNADGNHTLPKRLDEWLRTKTWANRIFVLTNRGLYHGSTVNLSQKAEDHEWWTFEGVTRFLGDGPQQGVESIVPIVATALNSEEAHAPGAAK